MSIWRDWKVKERLFEMLEKPKQFLRDNEKLILEKDRYIVKLKGKIYNKHMIVEANNFNINSNRSRPLL